MKRAIAACTGLGDKHRDIVSIIGRLSWGRFASACVGDRQLPRRVADLFLLWHPLNAGVSRLGGNKVKYFALIGIFTLSSCMSLIYRQQIDDWEKKVKEACAKMSDSSVEEFISYSGIQIPYEENCSSVDTSQGCPDRHILWQDRECNDKDWCASSDEEGVMNCCRDFVQTCSQSSYEVCDYTITFGDMPREAYKELCVGEYPVVECRISLYVTDWRFRPRGDDAFYYFPCS